MEITFDNGEVTSHYSPDINEFDNGSLDSLSEFNTKKHDQKRYTILFIEFLVITFLSGCLLWIFSMPYCGFVFKCGCTWRLAGGAEECNAFQPDSIDKCPVCVAPRIVIGMSHIFTLIIMIASYYASKYVVKKYSTKIEKRMKKNKFSSFITTSEDESSEDELLVSYSFTYEKRSRKTQWIKHILFFLINIVVLSFTFVVIVFFVYLAFFIASDYPTFIFE